MRRDGLIIGEPHKEVSYYYMQTGLEVKISETFLDIHNYKL